jgi:enamine deaminase RidA (YjgF/YER057c/UK114 family)
MRRIRLVGQLAEPISHGTDGVEAAGFVRVSGMLPLDVNGDVVGAGDVVRQDVADGPAVNTVRRRYFGDARRACW